MLLRHMCLSATFAVGSAISVADASAQTAGVTSYTDPLVSGYLHRASNMLRTGNALGTLDQLAAIDNAQCITYDIQSVKELAYEGAALFERKDPACIEILLKLAKEYPTSQYAPQALLTVGDWYWYQKDWHEALEHYDDVEIAKLGNDQRNLYTYRKALAYLNCGLKEDASPLFDSLRKTKDYALAAEYYSAYIIYLNCDYDQAYDMMSRIAEALAGASGETVTTTSERAGRKSANRHPNLNQPARDFVSDGIEPLYYMVQIEYLRGKYQDVIGHASTIMAKRPVADFLPELHRISGLSYFKTGNLASARGHLEAFVTSTESPNDDAVYALAAIEYADGDTDKARDRFRSLTDRQNILAQGSYLYLGQIAERDGDMNAAAMAFNKAANMAYDDKVAEPALYNYIVANSKGGSVPFASSIQMHEDFLRRYPTSTYSSAVEESLASAFFHENNYAKALAAINRVKKPSAGTLAAKQKILYKLGCGEISSGQLSSAATHLREAANMSGGDRTIASEACLWLGEAKYRSGDYNSAISAYTQSLRGNLSVANKVIARYGLAYSQFQNKQWSEAEKNFAAVAGDRQTSTEMMADALIREADCLLYMRQYSQAAAKYKLAANDKYGDTDYAAFRHAVVTGIAEGTEREIQLLDAFLNSRENSRWTPEVLLEAARTWTALDRPDKAASYYDRLLVVRPDSPQAGEALFNKALHLEDERDSAGALEAYLSLEQRGGKDYETEAIAGVMRNTTDMGQRTEYARRLLTLGGVVDEDAEYARFYDASALLRSSNPEAGVKALQLLAENPDNISGAMAAVELGEWYLEKGDAKNALPILEKFTDAGSIHAYWLAKGYIALADAYHADGNDYLAVEYLKSLRDNYPGDEHDILQNIDSKINDYSE